MELQFTRNNTNLCKGIAVLMLLFHHLFLYQKEMVIDFSVKGHNISSIIAVVLKVCVSIFIILSGYGLTKSQLIKKQTILKFYKKELYKLYSVYWFVWLIFVPVGVLIFNRTFEVVYGIPFIHKLVLNIFGLQYIIQEYGYNPTWWFMTLIIILYLLFPFLLKTMMSKYDMFILMVALFTAHLTYFDIFNGILVLSLLLMWMFPFILGVYLAKHDILNKYMNVRGHLLLRISVNFLFCCLLGILKFTNSIIGGGTRTDGIFGLVIILLVIDVVPLLNSKLKKLIESYGKYSFWIFLIHNFIYEFYFEKIVYYPRVPIIIFIIFSLVCLVIAIVMDRLLGTINKSLKIKT